MSALKNTVIRSEYQPSESILTLRKYVPKGPEINTVAWQNFWMFTNNELWSDSFAKYFSPRLGVIIDLLGKYLEDRVIFTLADDCNWARLELSLMKLAISKHKQHYFDELVSKLDKLESASARVVKDILWHILYSPFFISLGSELVYEASLIDYKEHYSETKGYTYYTLREYLLMRISQPLDRSDARHHSLEY